MSWYKHIYSNGVRWTVVAGKFIAPLLLPSKTLGSGKNLCFLIATTWESLSQEWIDLRPHHCLPSGEIVAKRVPINSKKKLGVLRELSKLYWRQKVLSLFWINTLNFIILNEKIKYLLLAWLAQFEQHLGEVCIVSAYAELTILQLRWYSTAFLKQKVSV